MDREARIEQLGRMLENEPGDVFLNYALGLEYLKFSDQYASAESQFRIVLDIEPDHIAAHYQLGHLFEKLQRISEALEFYRKGLEIAKNLKNNKAINEFNEAIFLVED